jgi:flagellar protein FliS
MRIDSAFPAIDWFQSQPENRRAMRAVQIPSERFSVWRRIRNREVTADKSFDAMPMNIYEQNRILNASPTELVRILYRAAIRAVENARENLRSGDVRARSKEISQAQAIVAELAGSVDLSQSHELGERLLALYDYMQTRLIEANGRQKEAPLAEVSDLLETVLEGWSECPAEELALAAR